ncbi:MAG TPA: hypothetical protein VKE94_18380 [Gemmataceae bacterium]|nr:hypothetical protein [Gemmataceae bacterium]
MHLLRPGLSLWFPSYLSQVGRRRAPRKGQPVHLLLCIADHFEPERGGALAELAEARVRAWENEYPRLFGAFQDSDGRPPRHTFFYPMEKYRRSHLDALARLCRAGFGEVEIHLHHDGDTSDRLRRTLTDAKQVLVDNHGLLARHRVTGQPAYGFVHGDWALDNSRPDGRCCGVPDELTILHETGCYCDFTMPSAPDDPTQTRQINSIYYATGRPGQSKGHDRGIRVGSGQPPEKALMLVQGPLLLNWRRRKYGLLPRVENGCLQGNQPPSAERIDLWLKARVQVATRPDWFFVKLHTHGAPEHNRRVLLGEPTVQFHSELARRARTDANFQYHYVTAREMYNLAKAAEAGWQGNVADARDFELCVEGSRAAAGVSPAARESGATLGCKSPRPCLHDPGATRRRSRFSFGPLSSLLE